MVNHLQAELKQVKDQLREKEKRDTGTDQSAHESYFHKFTSQTDDISKIARIKEGSALINEATVERKNEMSNAAGEPVYSVPKSKNMKLTSAKFSGKETYKGVGTGINEWVSRFMRQLERSEMTSGCW
jgi:hypothetical protein